MHKTRKLNHLLLKEIKEEVETPINIGRSTILINSEMKHIKRRAEETLTITSLL
jgi:hypothetical protein